MKSSLVRRVLVAASLAASVVLTGCAQFKLGAPAASMENIQKAKAVGMLPVAVGSFVLAPGKEPGIDKSLSLRGNPLVSPIDESFAKYLGETLRVELAAAGLIDPASATSIQGFLTASRADASIGSGSGALAARFVVMRTGRSIYDKELTVDASWESSFVGAVAIPAARNEYAALYRKLVGALLADPAFRKAMAP
ncbi:hypothetical protein BH11PSE8_BH11PSE8_30190 [soil metagenome]